MNTKYEVIWIDDEWEKMDAFKEECEVIHQIYLHPFRTQKAGMDEFDKNPKKWDAIILDAKMFDESENEVPRLDGLRKAVQHINEKSLLCKVPYFISTGQPGLMDNETFEQAFGTYYIKERDDQKLIQGIKDAAGKSTRFQTKTYYIDAIEQLESIDAWCCDKILDILEAMHFPEKNIDPLLYYNPLRQTLEYIFRKANKVNIIPDEFIGKDKDDVNLNQCVQFLSGRNADWIGIRFGGAKDFAVPAHIKDMMFQVLNLGNINSHSRTLNDDELKKLGAYFKENVCNSHYLIYSLALQICEIAVFIGKYIAANKDTDKNRTQCKTFGIVEKIEGNDSICVIKSKRPGRESCICISTKFAISKGIIDKKVVVIDESPNTNNTTKVEYPYFAIKIEPLEK
ncbi:MAG: hypothetical protein IJ190_06710 [Prevotella sp.]|nr:hypothetical protein [Prevotella sp.]